MSTFPTQVIDSAVVYDAEAAAPSVASAIADALVAFAETAPPAITIPAVLFLLMLQLFPGLSRRGCRLWPHPHNLPPITETLALPVRYLRPCCFGW